MTEKFDFDNALKALQAGQSMTGKGGVLTLLIKQLTEAALEAEMDSYIGNDVLPNRPNGKSRKTLKTTSGQFELESPCNRAGTFEPQIVKKYQTSGSDEIETKMLSMYGLGMSYRDISQHIQDIYGVSVSTGTISAITDTVIEHE